MIEEKNESVKPEEKKEDKVKGVRLRQTDIPACTLEDAIKVPQALWDDCGGKPTVSFQVANALNFSPTSSKWRYLSGAAVAYGLTNGAYNSKEISLTDLGRKIVAPTSEGENSSAIIISVLTPSVLNAFYNFYDGSKLPKDIIVKNKLYELGVPKEKTDEVYDLIIKNANFADFIKSTKGGDFIQIAEHKDIEVHKNVQAVQSESDVIVSYEEDIEPYEMPQELLDKMNIKAPTQEASADSFSHSAKPMVFITHGKNRKMVDQLKELLVFGQFEPVVSVERETTAIPVPDKVFNDMSKCQAGIIHIAEEQVFLDTEGKEHHKINENVLIEIGAAIAYYDKKVILLCQKNISLPSNLQGLYRCEYDGDQLDYTATMKLLKTFNEIRK